MRPKLVKPTTIPSRFRVLHEFDPVLRILKAFDANNFIQLNWRSLPPSIFRAIYATLGIFALFIFTVLLIWYVIENGADVDKLVFSVPVLICALWAESIAVDMIWSSGNITASLEQLESAVDQRIMDSEQSQPIYEQVEHNQISRVIVMDKIAYVALMGVFVMPAIFPISYILFGYPPPTLWTQPIPIHSLLGQTTYLGFYIDWLIEVNAIAVAYVTANVPIFIYMGVFLYIHAMAGDMKTRLMAIDTIGLQRSSNQRRMPIDNHRVWSVYTQEFVLHQKIIGIAKSLCSTVEITLFGMTLICIIDISLCLYGLELNATLNFDAIVAVIVIFLITNWTFVFFYLSEWMTMDLLKIGDHFYNSPWYCVLSAKERKMLALVIQQAQREVRLRGLGLFDGSLPVFASILRTAASYFIIIRRFK